MTRLQELFSGIRLRDALFMCGYAFFLAVGYMSFESPTVLASLGEKAALAQSTFLTGAMCGRVAVYAVTVFVGLRLRPHADPPLRAAVVTSVLALAGLLLTHLVFDFSAYVPFEKAAAWLVVGSLFFGGGSALATLMWARFSGTFDLRQIYVFVLLSNLLSLIVYLVATLLPPVAVFPAGMVVFFGSVALGCACLKKRDAATTEEYSRPVFNGAVSTLWRPALGTAILFFMSGLMLQMPHNQDISLSQFQNTALITQAVVMVALLLPALFMRNRPSLGAVYKVALPLSAAGFLLLPLVWSGGGGIANACAQLGSGVADIILWCMVAGMVYETKLPPTLLFSCTLLATNTAKLLGTVVGLIFGDSLAQEDIALTALALIAIYLVAMVSMFLFKDHELKGLEPPAAPVHADTAQSKKDEAVRRCAQLAKQRGLTPRESECLVYLGQDLTVRAIAEELLVSENTIKYHIKSIYQKLSVHSRDEVAALIENQRDE